MVIIITIINVVIKAALLHVINSNIINVINCIE